MRSLSTFRASKPHKKKILMREGVTRNPKSLSEFENARKVAPLAAIKKRLAERVKYLFGQNVRKPSTRTVREPSSLRRDASKQVNKDAQKRSVRPKAKRVSAETSNKIEADLENDRKSYRGEVPAAPSKLAHESEQERSISEEQRVEDLDDFGDPVRAFPHDDSDSTSKTTQHTSPSLLAAMADEDSQSLAESESTVEATQTSVAESRSGKADFEIICTRFPKVAQALKEAYSPAKAGTIYEATFDSATRASYQALEAAFLKNGKGISPPKGIEWFASGRLTAVVHALCAEVMPESGGTKPDVTWNFSYDAMKKVIVANYSVKTSRMSLKGGFEFSATSAEWKTLAVEIQHRVTPLSQAIPHKAKSERSNQAPDVGLFEFPPDSIDDVERHQKAQSGTPVAQNSTRPKPEWKQAAIGNSARHVPRVVLKRQDSGESEAARALKVDLRNKLATPFAEVDEIEELYKPVNLSSPVQSKPTDREAIRVQAALEGIKSAANAQPVKAKDVVLKRAHKVAKNLTTAAKIAGEGVHVYTSQETKRTRKKLPPALSGLSDIEVGTLAEDMRKGTNKSADAVRKLWRGNAPTKASMDDPLTYLSGFVEARGLILKGQREGDVCNNLLARLSRLPGGDAIVAKFGWKRVNKLTIDQVEELAKKLPRSTVEEEQLMNQMLNFLQGAKDGLHTVAQ